MRIRSKALAVGVGAAALSMVIGAPIAATPDTGRHGTLSVTKNADDGSPGTLRWAIEQHNADPSRRKIVIAASAGVIKLDSLLPPIAGPAEIQGSANPHSAAPVGIDMSNLVDVELPTTTNGSPNDCPGVTSGYGPDVRSVSNPALAVVDSGDVEISGLQIRNVCIGILGLRSHDLHLHDNVIVNSVGAAGIILTGDALDPAGSSTDTSYGHIVEGNYLINHGDGAEFTRGTRDSVFRDNTFINHDDAPAGVKGAAAVEYAQAGTNNQMHGNRVLGGYRTGLQLAGSDGVYTRNYVTGTDSAVTLGGSGANVFRSNVITGNEGIGLRVNPASTISRNSISGNGGLGIDLSPTGVNANDPLDTDGVQNHPVLTAAHSTGSRRATISGTLSSRPNATFTVELFASDSADPSGYGEGERYLTSVEVATDADGQASFSVKVDQPRLGGQAGPVFTATATHADGRTSEFGPAVMLD